MTSNRPVDDAPTIAWLCSAAVVVVVRLLHASDPNFDLGIQLQAAHNLLSGHGLSTYRHVAPNLAAPPSLTTLTYFPAGYSLVAAALMKAGFGVAAAIKALGALATLLGWWGWARLSRSFFKDGWQRGPAWRWAAVAVATTAPLLFTPPWGGTDIFLWAIVPWVVQCTVKASDENTAGSWRFDVLAGGLCGLAMLMRYAGLFLVVYAAGVMVWQSWGRIPTLRRRWSAFAVGVLPALALQGYVNYMLSNSPVNPGGLFIATTEGPFRRLWVGALSLRHADHLWAFWVPDNVAGRLFYSGASPERLALTACAFLSLLMSLRTYRRDSSLTPRDPRMAALALFVAVPLTLLASMMVSPSNYLADRRYYWPIVPLAALAAYSISSLVDVSRESRSVSWFRRVCGAYLAGFVAMSLVYTSLLFVPGRIGTNQRQKLLAGALYGWPSRGVTHEFSSSRRLVMQLLAEDPDTRLLTNRVVAFYWDPLVDGSKLYDLDCDALQPAYVDGPATFVILTIDRGNPGDLWYWRGNAVAGSLRRAQCFERLGRLEMVQRFPEEGMKVLRANVGAGEQIILKP
jgi:hypothetical protein